MATCFCRQPCEKYKNKDSALKSALAFKSENPRALVLVDVLEGRQGNQLAIIKQAEELVVMVNLKDNK